MIPLQLDVHLLASAILVSGLVTGSGKPVHEWQFVNENIRGTQVTPESGGMKAEIMGPVTFMKQPPFALVLEGDAHRRDRVIVASNIDDMSLPEDEITIESWVWIDEERPWAGVFSALQDNGSDEWGILLGTDAAGSRFSFGLASRGRESLTYLSSPGTLYTEAWYQLTGTYDGRAQRLYVDGMLVAEATEQLGPVRYPGRGVVVLGAYEDMNELYPLVGAIESVAVFDRALSSEEVMRRFRDRKDLFPGAEPASMTEDVTDWPTWMHDNRRSGMTGQEIPERMHLQWTYVPRKEPSPSWPTPAVHDPFNKRFNLEPRVVFDRAFHVVGAAGKVYFASSSEDGVTCLDLETGEEQWTFYSEGPVRNAPTLHGGKVLFGSDDGYVYALDPADGGLLWRTRIGPDDRRLAGNSRVISFWPVRTGVTAWKDHGFVCAGVFPRERVLNAILNLNTGEVTNVRDLEQTAQGYMREVGNGRLHVPTGRMPSGMEVQFTKVGEGGKPIPAPEAASGEEYPFARIGVPGRFIAGGDGEVAAIRASDGKKVWSAKVDGKAWSLAVVGSRLLVGTDTGRIYCFGKGRTQPRVIEPITMTQGPSDPLLTEEADRLLEILGEDRGYALVVGEEGADLAKALAIRSRLQVILASRDPVRAAALRREMGNENLGGRVSVHHVAEDSLPYVDQMFNLVTHGGVVAGADPARSFKELQRLVKPGRGRLVLKLDEDPWTRPPIAGGGEWTHPLGDAGNRGSSGDSAVGADVTLQWYGPPGPRYMVDRHQKNVAPLCHDGRIIVSGLNYFTGVDAHNGAVLWDRQIPDSFRAAQCRNCGNMAIGESGLFVAAGDSCLRLDPQTGNTLLTIGSPITGSDWGYMAIHDGVLLGSASRSGSSRFEVSPESWQLSYGDDGVAIISDAIFAFEPESGKKLWTYRPRNGVIVNPAIAADASALHFVECASSSARKVKDGRVPLKTLFSKGQAYLVSLDVQTGKERYRKKVDLSSFQHVVYLSVSDGRVLLAGSRNDGEKGSRRLMYELRGHDADTGKEVWRLDHPAGRQVVGGIHGEQTDRPVIVGKRIHLDVRTYDLETGELLNTWDHNSVGGCGTLSASERWGFRRMGNPTMIDLETGKATALTKTTRPGCWINILPVEGLILIPEASSGCSCSHPIQTSMVLRTSNQDGR